MSEQRRLRPATGNERSHALIARGRSGAIDGDLHALERQSSQAIGSGVVDAEALSRGLQQHSAIGELPEQVPAGGNAECLLPKGDIRNAEGIKDGK